MIVNKAGNPLTHTCRCPDSQILLNGIYYKSSLRSASLSNKDSDFLLTIPGNTSIIICLWNGHGNLVQNLIVVALSCNICGGEKESDSLNS